MLQSVFVCCSTSRSLYRATAVSTGPRATTSIQTHTSSFPCKWRRKERVRGIWPMVFYNCSTYTCMSRLCCVFTLSHSLLKHANQSCTSVLQINLGHQSCIPILHVLPACQVGLKHEVTYLYLHQDVQSKPQAERLRLLPVTGSSAGAASSAAEHIINTDCRWLS